MSEITEHVKADVIVHENRVTNASAVIDGGEYFVSLIDSMDGRGLLVRTYHPETGTQDVARLTPSDVALLRKFLFEAATSTYRVPNE